MCGIVGKIQFNKINKKDIHFVKQMADCVKHRGPDAEGFFENEDVAFGHKRLSIIDTSKNANQPMSDYDNEVFIIFNGEIYNSEEIRNKLIVNYKFSTDHSDTETIIYAYKEWGIDCIKKFNGFYAFALYDKQKREVYLVRDRLGKKPLYYVKRNDELYFSSEVHPFFVDSESIVKKRLNEEAIYHYLTFLTINAPRTFFKDIFKLESGHYLKITPTTFEKVKYWDISSFINLESPDSYDLAKEKTEDLLQKAMKYRTISDVGMSLALSGGLDSSLNLYFSKKSSKDLFSLNINYDTHSQYDEQKIAQRYSNDLGVKFFNKSISANYFEDLIISYMGIQRDMPLGDPNTALVYELSRMSAVKKAKVLIVGEGGDEIGGYPYYIPLNRKYKYLKRFSFLSSSLNILPTRARNILDVYYNKNVISRRHVHGFLELEKNKFWRGEKYNSYEVLNKYMAEIDDSSSDSFLRKTLNVEYKLRLPELILPRLDYPSMAASIEARSPFMDHELIEYSASLPFTLKMKNGPKSIIRDIAKDKLPNYILNHPKIGFGKLLTPFLKNTMPLWFVNEVIDDIDNPLHIYLNNDYLKSMVATHEKKGNMGFKLWIIYALSKWIKCNNFYA